MSILFKKIEDKGIPTAAKTKNDKAKDVHFMLHKMPHSDKLLHCFSLSKCAKIISIAATIIIHAKREKPMFVSNVSVGSSVPNRYKI